MLHAQGLGYRDLHVIDIAAVPYRLENTVGKSKNEDILDGFLAEIMIDAINLLLSQHLKKLSVEIFRGLQIVAKGLFDHDPPPLSRLLTRETGAAEMIDDYRKERRCGGEVEQIIAGRTPGLGQAVEQLPKIVISFLLAGVGGEVVQAANHPVTPQRIHVARACISVDRSAHALLKIFPT